MASLAFAVAGAAIGSTFGMPALGWAIGSSLGGALFPTNREIPPAFGPRLGDLKVQTSTYGATIPRVYGAARVAGNVIWAKDITETATTTSVSAGGKGGGGSEQTQTTYSYSCSFAIALCEGPIIGVRKIWANGKLIYNVADDASADSLSASALVDVTVYTGSETQTPSALMEATEGTGNVPAYRGTAYIEFTDLQLADYGNRLPNLEFEVVISGSSSTPSSVGASYGGGYYAGRIIDNGVEYYVIVAPKASGETNAKWKTSNTAGPASTQNLTNGYQASVDMAAVDSVTYPAAVFCRGLSIGGYTDWYIPARDELEIAFRAFKPLTSNNVTTVRGKSAIAYTNGGNSDDVAGDTHGINRSVGSGTTGTAYTSTIPAQTTVAAFVDGAAQAFTTAHTGAEDYYWSATEFSNSGAWIQVFGNGGGSVCAYQLDSGVKNSLNSPNISVRAFRRAQVPSLPTISITKPTLDAIVSDLCLQSDLTASDIDVTALAGTTVDGYVVANRGPIRGMIEPLMQAFFFDAVESDNKVKFVLRGGASAVTIPLADLAAREDAIDETPDAFSFNRKQEMELPLELNVAYLAGGNNYQPSQQAARRLAANSQSKLTVQLPIVMTDDKARQVADALLYAAWQERMQGEFATSREYAIYEPTDVVTVASSGATQIVRLTRKDEGANGVIRWRCDILQSTPASAPIVDSDTPATAIVNDSAAVYTQTGTGATMPAQEAAVALTGATTLTLMDLPLLRDADDDPGFYFATCGATTTWNGEQLYQSKDGGTVYNALANGLILSASTMGNAQTTLGAFARPERFDESNTLQVLMSAGTLASVTRDQVLNGSNVAMIGAEIIQFRTATLIAASTYQLSGLLRGRLGSEASIGTHGAAEAFVLLDTNCRTITQAWSEINAAYQYKPVSIGRTLAQTTAQAFTNTARRTKPLAPVHLAAGRNSDGDWLVQWVRRTRYQAVWRDGVDAPLGETSEAYAIDVMSGATVIRTISASSAACTYTAAQQVTDFGVAQASLTINVYQLSAEYGRGYVIIGAFG